MKKLLAWTLIGGLMVAFASGCNEKKQEPVAQASQEEEKLPPFPEDQVPPPPNQTGSREKPEVYKPPVDTAATSPAGAESAQQMPEESYAPEKKEPQTYVVQKGDTLYQIALKFYGTKKKWRKIFKANRELLKDNPDLIKPGMKLVIPRD